MLKGRLHSAESLDTVDGLGLRYILFTQGCLLRYLYCHNPGTWKISEPSGEVTVGGMMNKILPYKPYLDASGDGVTISGGEPLLQVPFLGKLFAELKENGVCTCLNTSARCANDTRAFQGHFKELQRRTDLILLDTKHINNDKHIRLTGKPSTHILNSAHKLSDMKQPVWTHHVLVPGCSNDKDDLIKLGEFINSLGNVGKFEILLHHQLGVHEWKTLGIAYELEDAEASDNEAVKAVYRYVNFKGKIPVEL